VVRRPSGRPRAARAKPSQFVPPRVNHRAITLARLSGLALILLVNLRVEWGVFPIGWPGYRLHAGAMNTTALNPETSDQTTTNQEASDGAVTQRLCRPIEGRMLAGVAAGIARYLGIDVTAVRIVLAVLAVVGGAGVPIYLAGWLLIPEEGSDQSMASAFIQSLQARSR